MSPIDISIWTIDCIFQPFNFFHSFKMVVSNHIAHIVISEHQVCKLSIMYISLINRSVHVDDVHKYTKKSAYERCNDIQNIKNGCIMIIINRKWIWSSQSRTRHKKVAKKWKSIKWYLRVRSVRHESAINCFGRIFIMNQRLMKTYRSLKWNHQRS